MWQHRFASGLWPNPKFLLCSEVLIISVGISGHNGIKEKPFTKAETVTLGN